MSLVCPACGFEIRRAPVGATRRQKQCLDAIAMAIATNGVQPSFAQIAAALGNTSRASVAPLVRGLRERGLLENAAPGRRPVLALTEIAWSLYRHDS